MIRIVCCQSNRLLILLERAEMEICFSMANGMFKLKMDIDRHGPRLMHNICQHLISCYQLPLNVIEAQCKENPLLSLSLPQTKVFFKCKYICVAGSCVDLRIRCSNSSLRECSPSTVEDRVSPYL